MRGIPYLVRAGGPSRRISAVLTAPSTEQPRRAFYISVCRCAATRTGEFQHGFMDGAAVGGLIGPRETANEPCGIQEPQSMEIERPVTLTREFQSKPRFSRSGFTDNEAFRRSTKPGLLIRANADENFCQQVEAV